MPYVKMQFKIDLKVSAKSEPSRIEKNMRKTVTQCVLFKTQTEQMIKEIN